MIGSIPAEVRNGSVVLAVDVGNTHTVLALFRGEEVVDAWRVTTRPEATSDEALLRIGELLPHSRIRPGEITHAALASVVPGLDRVWSKALTRFLGFVPQTVSCDNCLGLPIRYDDVKSLGTDRICNALALLDLGYETAVALDLGTATTIDVLKDGGFHGGVILPGITSELNALTTSAAMLSPVTLTWTDRVVSTNTADAMRAGILRGFVGQLDHLMEAIRKELGVDEIPVVATGGWSESLGGKSGWFRLYEPHLTVKGIRLVALSARR